MNEYYSKAEDCYFLASKLKKKLGNKIDFYGSTNIEIPSGKYLSSYRRNNGEYMHNGHYLPFYFKFSKQEFLRISVGSHYSGSSLGEKLAALSDFYEVLSEEYGNPTIFYTTKDDDEGLLNLQWSFINKELEIAKFKADNYFDDAKIDTLIVFGESKENNSGYNIRNKDIISKRIGLPYELLYLAANDIENYIKHKKGKNIVVATATKIDGIPVTSFEKKVKRKLK